MHRSGKTDQQSLEEVDFAFRDQCSSFPATDLFVSGIEVLFEV